MHGNCMNEGNSCKHYNMESGVLMLEGNLSGGILDDTYQPLDSLTDIRLGRRSWWGLAYSLVKLIDTNRLGGS